MVTRKHRRSSRLLSKALSSSQCQYTSSLKRLSKDVSQEEGDISQNEINVSSSSVSRDKANVVDTSIVERFLSDPASRARKTRRARGFGRVGRVRIVESKVNRSLRLGSSKNSRKIRGIIKDKPFRPPIKPIGGATVEPPRPWPHR